MNNDSEQITPVPEVDKIALRYDYLLHASVPKSEYWGITYPDSEGVPHNMEELRQACLHYKDLSLKEEKYIDSYKKYNYHLAQAEYTSCSEYCHSLSFVVQASRTDVCNLSCKFCRHEPIKNINALSIEIWQQALPELLPSVIEFISYCWGEPLLDEYFGATYALARKYRAKVSFITNWQQVTEQNAETVLRDVQRIFISVDTVNPDVFEKLRNGGTLEKIERNLQLLYSISRRLGLKLPWIGLSVVLTRNTLPDLPHLIEWAYEKGMMGVSARRVVMRENIERLLADETIDLSSNEYWDIHHAAVKTAETYRLALNMPVQLYLDRDDTRCLCPWTHLYMNPEGKLHLCAFSHRNSLGTVPIQSDFWNSGNLRKARREFLKRPRCSECASLDSVGFTGASQMRGY
ncbi:MAG: hypothetical protein HW390_3342 [Candidatus Brocadiaceae bacterium]|nr:hypothetical protein [Candidatus Brocadiaceae bacterium]